MAPLAEISTSGVILLLFFGQLARVDVMGVSIPVLDIFITILAIANICQIRKPKNIFLVFFLIVSWASYAISLANYGFHPKSFFYLIRLSNLLSLFIFPPVISKRNQRLLIIVLIANMIFGLIQYLCWPDITYFDSLDWDPHLYRLVSTFIDPTFTGIIYLISIIYLYHSHNTILTLPFYLSMALTYSRSTLMSFLIAFSYVSIQRRDPRILIRTMAIVIATIFLLPRMPGEGTKLERTSSIMAKIDNYRQAMVVFWKSPILGHGYNNLFYAKDIHSQTSHANSGFDSSLMTIATTSGIVGLILFVLGFLKEYSLSTPMIKAIYLAIFFHSLFANSLLYPWVLVLLPLVQTRYHT